MIADFHYRQRASDVRGRHAQHLCLLKLTQRLKLLLFIVFRNAQQILAQLIAIGIHRGRLVQRVGVKQFIKQQRITRQLAGDHRRCRAE
ncbi:hypothetical protein D1872_287060 [compost metagenome]